MGHAKDVAFSFIEYLKGSQLDDLSKDTPDAVPHSLQTMQCSAFLAGMFGSGLMR